MSLLRKKPTGAHATHHHQVYVPKDDTTVGFDNDAGLAHFIALNPGVKMVHTNHKTGKKRTINRSGRTTNDD